MSPITVEQMAIHIDLALLGFPYHTIYAGLVLGLTYINLYLDPPKREPICATREHSTPPPCTTPGGFIGWVHTTLTISHAQCAVVFSHNRIAKVSGLPGYMASTISHDHKRPYNDWSLIDTGGALRQDSILDASEESAQSQIKFMIIIKPQGIPWVRTFETNLLLNSYLVSMTKHH